VCSIINRTTSTPPGSPANGDAYIVQATGTGLWTGHDNAIAIWTTDNPAAGADDWEFYTSVGGFLVYSVADITLFLERFGVDGRRGPGAEDLYAAGTASGWAVVGNVVIGCPGEIL
jgi:hypothetical protein